MTLGDTIPYGRLKEAPLFQTLGPFFLTKRSSYGRFPVSGGMFVPPANTIERPAVKADLVRVVLVFLSAAVQSLVRFRWLRKTP